MQKLKLTFIRHRNQHPRVVKNILNIVPHLSPYLSIKLTAGKFKNRKKMKKESDIKLTTRVVTSYISSISLKIGDI